jgi:hypothetical protein
MKVRFVGGPLDGQERLVEAPEPRRAWPLYWSLTSDRQVASAHEPGEPGLLEYLYRGDGTAEYVAGLPKARQERTG